MFHFVKIRYLDTKKCEWWRFKSESRAMMLVYSLKDDPNVILAKGVEIDSLLDMLSGPEEFDQAARLKAISESEVASVAS